MSKDRFERCLVIGGAGMLGYEIVSQLLGEGKFVRVLDLQPFNDDRVQAMVGDIRSTDDVRRASNLFDFMAPFLIGLNLPVPRRTVPYRLAYFLAWLTEIFNPRSYFNRFSVVQTCVDHTFVHDRASRDFPSFHKKVHLRAHAAARPPPGRR